MSEWRQKFDGSLCELLTDFQQQSNLLEFSRKLLGKAHLSLFRRNIVGKLATENYPSENLSLKVHFLVVNPVHKKVPVLLHNGKPINESLVIIEYIDEVWKGVPLLPQDAYQKAVARFWAKFIDDKCNPAIYKVFASNGDEQAIAEACEQLQILENELKVKGTKFFGSENINIVDISADFIAYWLGIIEEATEIKFVTKEKFPKIHEWADNFINSHAVKEILPPREHLLAFYRKRFGKA